MIKLGTLNGHPVAVLTPPAVPTDEQMQTDLDEYADKYCWSRPLVISKKTLMRTFYCHYLMFKDILSGSYNETDTLVFNP